MADLRVALAQAANQLEIAENALLCSSFHNAAQRAKQAARAARAALAEPQGDRPTDEELNALWNRSGIADEHGNHTGNIFEFARAVLARWGRPTPPPTTKTP